MAVGLALSASVGTRNDTRGPFVIDVPFVYSSSLHVSGSVYTPHSHHQLTASVRVGSHLYELVIL